MKASRKTVSTLAEKVTFSGSSTLELWNALWVAIDAGKLDYNKVSEAGVLNDANIETALKAARKKSAAELA